MPFVLWEIVIPLIIAFLLGLLFGWLWWGWRRTKITYTEWETMRQKANRASSVEAEAELVELRAENERLQADIDNHVCETGASTTDLGTGVLGLSGAAAVAGDNDDDTAATDDTDDTATADDAVIVDADRPVAGERHPYGPGSHAPFSDDPKFMPEGYPIKGNADSMLYHREDSRSYRATIAEVWFDTPESAEAAGFGLANSHPKG